MSDLKYVGQTAAAKLVSLVKIALNNKADKTNATTSAAGLMSAADKAKLDGIEEGATMVIVDDAMSDTSTNPVQNKAVKAALDKKASTDIATPTAPGLMSAIDKSKLNGIEIGANKTVVDALLDATSTNPVQNKAVKTALDGKAGTAEATTGAAGLMSAADKTKLDGVEAGANKTTVDAALDAASENPVQNKAVKTALDGKLSTRGGDVTGSLSLTRGITVGRTEDDAGIHLYKDRVGVAKMTSGSADVDDNITMARLKVASPTEDEDAATKKYVDDRAVRYDAKQTLTSDQKLIACSNIGAVNEKRAWVEGEVVLLPRGADGAYTINITPSEKSNDYTLTLDAGPENVPVYVAGLETPTDAQTDYAANVAFVKAKIAEVAASGGVDVDNALSATSTNPVQNKVVTAALTGKAGTAVATASANGLMSKDDKAKLDGITGQVTIDKLNAPDHATDLVQYGAFQIAAQQIISQIPTVPDVLPNPKALVIKIGSTTVTYDGSAAKTVEIADGSEVSY